MSRNILYADVVTAAHRVAAIMVKGARYDMDTNGGSTAAVRRVAQDYYGISLPSIAPTRRLSRTEANFILGLLVHELGHVRFTSFAFPADAKGDLMALTNALEDCREETAVILSKEPPNGADLLAQVTETMSLRAMAQGGNWAKYRPEEALTYAVCIDGRLAQPLYGDLPATDAYAGRVPQWARDMVAKYLPEIVATQSTDECFALARKMLAAIPAGTAGEEGEPGDEPGEPGETPTEGGTGDGEPGDGTGEAGGGKAGDGKAGDGDGTGEAPDGATDGSPVKGKGKGKGDGEAGGDAPADPGDDPGEAKGGKGKGEAGAAPEPFDPAKILGDMLKDKLPKVGDADRFDSRFTSTVSRLDRAKHENNTYAAKMHTNPARAKKYRNDARVAGLAPKVRMMLHSQDDSFTSRYETAGRLDRRAIVRLETGNPRVFTKRTASDGIQTGVGFLLDMSSSMGIQYRYAHQAMAAIALGDACVRGGADVAIWGFGPDASDPAGGCLLPFKDWHETMDVGAARLAGHGSLYGTNLCPSLMAAARAMAEHPGVHRRILLVMTDGDCSLGRDCLRITARFAAAKYGIIIVGIGIGCSVGDAFPLSARVDNVKDLAGTAMKSLLKAVG